MSFWNELFSGDDELFNEQRSQHGNDLEEKIVSDLPGTRRGITELSSDESFTNPLHRQNLGGNGRITYGKIIYSQPYTSWYRVQLDDMDGDLPCCRLSDSAPLPFSVRDTSPLPANSSVILWIPDEVHYGYILGAVSDRIESGALVYPDWISQGSNCGIKRDAYYYELFDHTIRDGGAIDFSNSRPLDSLSSGEWGRMTDLGGGIHLDMFMSFLRMDETCGLWLFYLDRLARLCGYNFDLQTAISEIMVRNDNGEGLHYSGSTPYPWEALGKFAAGVDVAADFDDRDVHYGSARGKLEPTPDTILPIYRLEEFRGYLGQGFMRQLRFPQRANGSANEYGNPVPSPALFRERISLDGSYSLSSAHSISITKRLILPAPQRLAPPESSEGDTTDNYRFSGLNGNGVSHKVNSPNAEDEESHVQETMCVSDIDAHNHEWKGVHPFHYHEEDFSLPDQSEHATVGMQQIQTPLNFTALQGQSYLNKVDPTEVEIDHRYGDVKYFPVTAGVFLLPEGGIVIRDGYGGEIRMVAGSIQISCPGDVWLQPGRNVNMYAGDDIIGRAVNSMDFTTTNHDVRFKAERNMEFLAGNNGQQGRMLFENQAAGPTHDAIDKFGEDVNGSGFVFKAPHSDLVTACRGIYIRTGSDDVDEGPIVLDAAKGQSDIHTVSRSFNRHIRSTATDSFPVEGDKDVVNSYSSSNSQIQTSCQFDGGLFITKGGVSVSGEVNVINGHIGTEFAERFDGQVGVLKEESLKRAKQNLQETLRGMETARENAEQSFEDTIEEVYYDDENQPGHPSFQQAASFSLRTEKQMNTEKFLLAETYWQQMARLADSAPTTWTEKRIVSQGRVMMPHPGLINWTENPIFLAQDLKAHDPTTGLDSDRDDQAYEEFEFELLGALAPDGAYPIVSSL